MAETFTFRPPARAGPLATVAASTSSTLSSCSRALRRIRTLPTGAESAGWESCEKITVEGQPVAAMTCIGPVSLPTAKRAAARQLGDLGDGRFAAEMDGPRLAQCDLVEHRLLGMGAEQHGRDAGRRKLMARAGRIAAPASASAAGAARRRERVMRRDGKFPSPPPLSRKRERESGAVPCFPLPFAGRGLGRGPSGRSPLISALSHEISGSPASMPATCSSSCSRRSAWCRRRLWST